MSRSRNIKPGFFKNEDLAELPFWIRILYAGLWCESDREGRFEDRPVKLKMAIFPADSVDVDAGLLALEQKGFILRYVAGTKRYGQVIAWKKHQNPHFKEQMSVIPAPESLGFDAHAKTVKPQASIPIDDAKASGIAPIHEHDGGTDDSSMGQKPEALPPVDGGVNRADSLIPDSLIPDSLEEREKPSNGKKPKRQSRPERTLSVWLASLDGEMAIPEDDPVYTTAEAAGIPDEFVALEWAWFKRKYGPGAKRYRDWRQAFRNAVDGAWGNLWRTDAEGRYVLTTAGQQLQRVLDSEADPA